MDKVYDVIVVGSGAAGMAVSIFSARKGLSVLLLERNPTAGVKISLSGGARCNITNQNISKNDYYSDSINRAFNILKGFNSEQVIKFFKEIGINIKVAEEGKCFPVTEKAVTVVNGLIKEIKALSVEIQFSHRVTKVSHEKGIFYVNGENFSFSGKNLVITTGGLAYPKTGSSGDGYAWAEQFGHKLISQIPALVPLSCNNKELQDLSGISLDCAMSLRVNKKVVLSRKGALLFTHFGVSGPVVLNVSREWQRISKKDNVKLTISFLPQEKEISFLARLEKVKKDKFKISLKRVLLEEDLPERLVKVIFKQAGVLENVTLSLLSRYAEHKLMEMLFRYPLLVKGVLGYEKAEVTAGGVDLKELDNRTLESRVCPRLFFCGEICDVDGGVGGFNFGWAWASAYAVAQGINFKY